MASGLAYRKKTRNRKSHVDKMMLKRSIENGDEENWNSLCKLYFIGSELERERAIEETGKFIQFRPKSNNFKLLPKCYILIHFQPDAESADDKELHNCYLRAIFFPPSSLSQLLSTAFLVSHSLSFRISLQRVVSCAAREVARRHALDTHFSFPVSRHCSLLSTHYLYDMSHI